MLSIDDANHEYERLHHLVLAGHHLDAQQPAVELRNTLATDPGLPGLKKCLATLLLEISRLRSHNSKALSR